MNTQAEAVAAREALAYSPAPSACPRVPGVHLSAITTALLAAGITSFVVFTPKQEPASPLPEGAPQVGNAAPQVAAAPEAAPAAPEVLTPFEPQAMSPQYEDGLVPLSLLDLAAAKAPAVQVVIVAAKPAAAPTAAQPRAYRGPILSIEDKIKPRLFPLVTSLLAASRGHAAAAVGRWLTEEARIAQARLHPVVEHTWAQSAREYADTVATAKGRTVSKMDIVCEGHQKNCTNGLLKVTYDNGTQETLKYDPLVLDLAGNGFKASGKLVDFDLDGSGRPRTIADLPVGAGLLVLDSDKDAVAGGGPMELFSAATDLDGDLRPDGFADGFEAFNGLVKKAVRENVLAPTVLKEMRLGAADLAALERSYGLKVRAGGFLSPAVSLAQAGIVEIGLSANQNVRQNAFDGQGTDITRRAGAEFLRADGTRGEYADLWLSTRKLLLASAR